MLSKLEILDCQNKFPWTTKWKVCTVSGDLQRTKLKYIKKKILDGELPSGSLTAVCGTSVYIAPELYNRKSFNIKADMYSLGMPI
jgi:serine/threonine protein kinase